MAGDHVSLDSQLSQKTAILGLKLWAVIGIGLGGFTVLVLFLLSLIIYWISARKKVSAPDRLQVDDHQLSVPVVCKDITEVVVDGNHFNEIVTDAPNSQLAHLEGHLVTSIDVADADKELVTFVYSDAQVHPNFESFAFQHAKKFRGKRFVPHAVWELEGEKERLHSASELFGPFPSVPAYLRWGRSYMLHELKAATNDFADMNVVGEGGYGIVYQGLLSDGFQIAVKKLFNNRGQAENVFSVEVEAIGRIRHKNLVGLLGYCAEGYERMLIYEYVDNGNLDQWLHGQLGEKDPIPWDRRMKILTAIAKGLSYLHEDLEPKVVHRDVTASNVLLDSSWNAKLSDFGLAKLLDSGRSHVTTRVMGTFGYVAPEYASTGLLTQRSDVYSFGVLMMQVITGRNAVDYGRPAGEVNLVDWMKMMLGSRRAEEVVDPRLSNMAPSSRALKRALLVALRCVDPDAQKRPRMGHVLYMLEADDFSFHRTAVPLPTSTSSTAGGGAYLLPVVNVL